MYMYLYCQSNDVHFVLYMCVYKSYSYSVYYTCNSTHTTHAIGHCFPAYQCGTAVSLHQTHPTHAEVQIIMYVVSGGRGFE